MYIAPPQENYSEAQFHIFWLTRRTS